MESASTSRARWILLLSLVLLAPALAAGALMLWRSVSTQVLLPDLAPADVTRVEIVRREDGTAGRPLVLERIPDASRGLGGWRIASAADAPADSARVEAMLRNLSTLRGTPDTREKVDGASRLEVHLFNRRGHALGAAAFRGEYAARLPDGQTIRTSGMPALPHWPSAWTSMKPPKIDVSHVVSVERPGVDGAERLPPEAVGQTVAVLLALNAQDFSAGSDVRWIGAKTLRVIMDDGATIDLQQVPDGAGRYFLRMTSDKLPEVRDARRFAFRVEKPIP